MHVEAEQESPFNLAPGQLPRSAPCAACECAFKVLVPVVMGVTLIQTTYCITSCSLHPNTGLAFSFQPKRITRGEASSLRERERFIEFLFQGVKM